jgi:hypothetical protein
VPDDDPVMDEWLKLLTLTTTYMEAAEGLIDALQGKLGVDTLDPNARNLAAAEITTRVTRYMMAKRKLVAYAKDIQVLMRP